MYVSVPRYGLCARLLWNGVGEHVGYGCLVSLVGWGRSMADSSVGPFTPRESDVTRVTEATSFIPRDTQLLGGRFPPGEATSFHKIHSYWEDGSPRGSCRKPRAMWRGYGEVPMGRWTGLWRRGSVVALTFVFLLRWTPDWTGGLGCQVVVDKELDGGVELT